MECKRQTIAETVFIAHKGAMDKTMLRHEIAGALRRLHLSIPPKARLIPLPDDLAAEYRREIHLHGNSSESQIMEIAIKEWKEYDRLFLEYSTDYTP